MVNRTKLIAECKKLKSAGANQEDILSYIRNEGCWKIDSIVIVREALELNLGDAKKLVHLSSTWRDQREKDDALHDRIADNSVGVSNGKAVDRK